MNAQLGNWPVYKGSSFEIWNPDTGDYYASVDARLIAAHLQEKRLRQHKTPRSPFAEFARGHIENPETLPCLRPRIAFRKVTNPTNTRTVIPALIPGQAVLTDAAQYLLWPRGTAHDEAFLLGVLSSMILDWYARRVVELNFNFHIFNNLPIPLADLDNDPAAARIVEISGRLAAVDERFGEWAAEVGVPVGSARDETVKQDLVCELDACVAFLYCLDEEDLAVVYETFSETVDYSDRHAAVLVHFRRLTG